MRTTVIVPISCSVDEANFRLKNYFGTNGYVAEQNGAEVLMRGGDIWVRGIWYIFPQVVQGQVILQGFVGKPGRSEKDLDGFVGAMVKAGARTALGELQQILSYPASSSGNQNMVPQYQNHPASMPNPAASQTYQNYAPIPGNIAEKNAALAIWSIVIGGAACVLPFIGLMIGGLGIFIGLWMGFTALKTSKRTLAILGIVLNFIGLLVVILVLALQVNSIL